MSALATMPRRHHGNAALGNDICHCIALGTLAQLASGWLMELYLQGHMFANGGTPKLLFFANGGIPKSTSLCNPLLALLLLLVSMLPINKQPWCNPNYAGWSMVVLPSEP